MKIQCVWEHNGDDSILYSANFVGAFTRGKSKGEAIQKMPSEIRSYLMWKGDSPPDALEPEIVQEKASALTVSDADSDVLFNDEKAPLTAAEYEALKSLAMKSARDFLALYRSIPDKDKSALPPRATFYGEIPRTAREMYKHTKSVNTYYFGEIGVQADNNGTIGNAENAGLPCWSGSGIFWRIRFFSEATTRNGRCERCCADSSGTTEFTPRQCTGWR